MILKINSTMTWQLVNFIYNIKRKYYVTLLTANVRYLNSDRVIINEILLTEQLKIDTNGSTVYN